MNVSIIGPEGSGKTTFAVKNIIKRVGFGRPVFYIGKLKTDFIPLELKDWHKKRNAIIFIDDANTVLESVDAYNKNLNLKEPVIMHRHYNLLNIGVFHSDDDTVKFFFRQSRFMFYSTRYRDTNYQNNKFIKGITPLLVGRPPFTFYSYQRY